MSDASNTDVFGRGAENTAYAKYFLGQSYLNVLKNKEILNLQNEYLDLSKLNYEKAERLYDAGRYSKTDAMRWQVDYQRQQSIVTTNQSNLRSSRIILSRLLNAAVGEFFEVEKRIPEPLLNESDELLKLSDLELLEMIQLEMDTHRHFE